MRISDWSSDVCSSDLAAQAWGAPQLAINSAGIIINKVLAETTAAEFSRVVDVNLNGSFNFAAAVLPTMGKGSRLALIASMAGLTSNYAYAAYGASKRSAERRVGKECVRKCRTRWSPDP